MARIRTIKPEFPQSESMGRISRDARLLFIELWTLCDDSGRTRGNSRMLASLLFPYDDDAPALIDGWVVELEKENCIIRYQADGQTYIQVCNWLNHQKIDKPSQSKIPEFDQTSRIIANPRESSSLDQGSRTKDQGPEDRETSTAPAKPSQRAAKKCPSDFSPDEPDSWIAKNCPDVDWRLETEKFKDYTFKNAMTDWHGAWRNWMRRANESTSKGHGKGKSNADRIASTIAEFTGRRGEPAVEGINTSRSGRTYEGSGVVVE